MHRRFWLRGGCAALAGLLAVACGGAMASRPPVATPQPAPPTTVAALSPTPETPRATPPPDAIDTLIAQSQARFDTGAAELKLGHLSRAKVEFNAAIDLLLESPSGARSNRRLQEQFDRLVDRISAFEMRTLAEGDGFAEKPTVPASIDQLLDQPTSDTPTPKPEIREVVAADLQTTLHDVPIPLNDKVLSWIEVFQGRLHDWFQTSMQRGMPYLPMIQNTFRSQGLPLDLAYIPIVESAFRTDALSRASAKGFWQLMKGTATSLGLTQNWYIDERSNPEKATLAAARYLKLLSEMFDGDWHLALASYNGGPGYIQRVVKRKGQPDFWALADKASPLPRETREYVPMVLASIVIARNPAQYGFTFEPVAPPEYETVSLPGPADLRKIAEWAGVSVDDIQRLNPELRRWTTPVRGEAYLLRVPKGTAQMVEQRLGELPPEELAPLQWHTVRRGESLTTIANKLHVRRTDLAEANYLGLKTAVTPGQKLVIPLALSTLLASRTDRPEPAPTPARSAPARAAPSVSDSADRVKITYHVRKGDSLYSIAQQFHTTIANIRSLNGLKSDRITPGERLTISTSRQHSGGHRP
ncbi:MAG: LysM peptidoglycan-binding domain-containing protein [Acidobacteria bacterium]|nr:LysM peptidoglycan-binding domain-containing protein [Acidobacteriota bacterium]